MIIADSTGSIAAGANSGNVLSDSPFRVIGRQARQIIVGITSDQVDSVFDFLVGGISIASRSLIPGTDRYPQLPEDMVLQVTGLPGQELFLVIYAVTAMVAPGAIFSVQIL